MLAIASREKKDAMRLVSSSLHRGCGAASSLSRPHCAHLVTLFFVSRPFPASRACTACMCYFISFPLFCVSLCGPLFLDSIPFFPLGSFQFTSPLTMTCCLGPSQSMHTSNPLSLNVDPSPLSHVLCKLANIKHTPRTCYRRRFLGSKRIRRYRELQRTGPVISLAGLWRGCDVTQANV